MRKTCVVIGSDANIPKKVGQAVENLGAALAKENIVVVCGGRGGVMRAVCKGAKEKGGLTIGILPSNDGSDANEYVEVALPTGLGFNRNIIIAACCDVVVAFAGSTGTLSEIALALNNNKTVFIVEDSGGISERFDNLLEGDPREGLVHKTSLSKVAKEVLAFLKAQ